MGLQARMSAGDKRLYDPNRDVAHCFGAAVNEVAARLEDGRWPIVSSILKRHKVGEDQLGEACAAFIRFVQGAADNPKENMAQALARAGWNNVPDAAQVAYMAYLGTVMAGMFYHGAKTATLGGEGPCDELGYLSAAGERCSAAMARPRWRRKLSQFFYRVREAFRAIRGRKASK